MGQDAHVLEIERTVTTSFYKLVGGAFLVLCGVAIATGGRDLPVLIPAAMMGVPGVLMIASNVWLIAKRPLCLRATEAGLWFGGGPIIPWSQVELIYESSPVVSRYGMSAKLHGVVITLRRWQTVLRLPMTYWITSFAIGDIRISTARVGRPPAAIVAELERLRFAACGDEDGALAGASAPPTARAIRRPRRPT